jgi:hypothetical protein
LVILCSIAVAACGGGGGGSSTPTTCATCLAAGRYAVTGATVTGAAFGSISASSTFADRINITPQSGNNCFDTTFYATVSGNSMSIPMQTSGYGITISGSGTISSTSSSLAITMNLTYGGTSFCATQLKGTTDTEIWTKQ